MNPIQAHSYILTAKVFGSVKSILSIVIGYFLQLNDILCTTFFGNDFPRFLCFLCIICYLESKWLEYERFGKITLAGPPQPPINRTSPNKMDDVLSRTIFLRDRVMSVLAYYCFVPAFLSHFVSLEKAPTFKGNPWPFNHYYEYEKWVRMFCNHHCKLTYVLGMLSPLTVPFFSLIAYRYIVRRRNGYDTIWMDHLKRFHWHGSPIPTLKHLVRYHWGAAWFTDLTAIFATALINLFNELMVGIYAGSYGLAKFADCGVMYCFYYFGITFYIIGVFFAIMGLRSYTPFIHWLATNQVGAYNPEGHKKKRRAGKGFNAVDSSDYFYKFFF
jgi:hypothetical protein